MEIRKKVERALKRHLKPTVIDIEDDDGMFGVVVSDRFRRMGAIDRQTEIDNALRNPDPKFPDCAPGETVRLKGWLSFYEGSDVEVEFRRIDGKMANDASSPRR